MAKVEEQKSSMIEFLHLERLAWSTAAQVYRPHSRECDNFGDATAGVSAFRGEQHHSKNVHPTAHTEHFPAFPPTGERARLVTRGPG
jgi:hypothetical protein